MGRTKSLQFPPSFHLMLENRFPVNRWKIKTWIKYMFNASHGKDIALIFNKCRCIDRARLVKIREKFLRKPPFYRMF